jgi:hypothetical protein
MVLLLPSYFGRKNCIKFSISIILFISFSYLYVVHFQKSHSTVSYFDFIEQPHIKLSSNFRWCEENPFLTRYDKRLVNDFDRKWYVWKQVHLTQTFDFLKKYVQFPEKTASEFVRIVYPVTALIPCSYNNNTLIRYGNSRDAGKWLCGLEELSFNDSCIVYSLGSNNDFLFELSILSKTQCTVHTFDCTSSPPQEKHDRLHFHKICLGENSPLQHHIFPQSKQIKTNQQSTERLFLTFDQILKMQKHKKIHVLKMDIEGAEY